MNKLLLILSLCFVFATELEIDGDLKIQGDLIFQDETSINTAPIIFPIYNGMVEFVSDNYWIVPENITSVYIEMVGAGGDGGSGGCCNYAAGGGGGGGGGYLIGIFSVTPGDSLEIQVGNGDTEVSIQNQILALAPKGLDGGNVGMNGGSSPAGSGGSGSCGQIITGSGITRCGHGGDTGTGPSQGNSTPGGEGGASYRGIKGAFGTGGKGGNGNGNQWTSGPPGENGTTGYIYIQW